MSIGSILDWKCRRGCSLHVFVCHDSDDSWKPRSRCWKIFAGWAQLRYHPPLPVAAAELEWRKQDVSPVVVPRELLCETNFIFFVTSLMIWVSFLRVHLSLFLQKSITFFVSLLEPEETHHRKQVGSSPREMESSGITSSGRDVGQL